MSAVRIAAIVLITAHDGRREVARSALTLVGIVLAGLFAPAGAASAQSRGELLYTTHCIACHSTQMHWRDQRRATDLDSLKEQVRLWQGRALLSWTEDDIVEVTRYLNQRIYRFGQVKVGAWPDPSSLHR
jgi:mono/diheme cytochrome c family protein